MYGLFYIAEFELQGYKHHELREKDIGGFRCVLENGSSVFSYYIGKGRDFSTSKSVWDLVMNS